MGDLSIMKNLHSVAPGSGLKLLIPIDASAESAWSLRYAIECARAGVAVEVCLLHIAEPVRNWEVLRFYTEAEVSQYFQERAAIFLEAAANTLREAGIPSQRYFRQAEAVAGIIDLAEELNCSAIVVPSTYCLGLFPAGLGRRLRQRHGTVPLTLVQSDGSPEA